MVKKTILNFELIPSDENYPKLNISPTSLCQNMIVMTTFIQLHIWIKPIVYAILTQVITKMAQIMNLIRL
jgi:hypothetical protein